jgi:putative hydrolase of the HAD superfamily
MEHTISRLSKLPHAIAYRLTRSPALYPVLHILIGNPRIRHTRIKIKQWEFNIPYLCRMPSKTYNHIFIDLDKTIWDFDANALETFKDIFSKYELSSNGVGDLDRFLEVYTRHNEMLWGLYRNNQIKKEKLNIMRFELTLNDFGIDDLVLATKIAEDYVTLSPLKTITYPGSIEALKVLSRATPLHLITNGFEEVQQKKIDQCRIRGFFTTITTSELAGVKKPDPGIFNHALSRAGAKPDESIMIGDDLKVDIEGSMNIGMDQLYFNPRKLAHNGNPTHETHSWDEIVRIFKGVG